MRRNLILLVSMLFSGLSLLAQQQAAIKVVETASPTGEIGKRIGIGIDKDPPSTESLEVAPPPSPCSAVTSDGKAKKNYVAKFTSPCNIENSTIFEVINTAGTVVNVQQGLAVDSVKTGGIPTLIGGCSSPALASIAFGSNTTCVGYALAFDGTNTQVNVPSSAGSIIFENDGQGVAIINAGGFAIGSNFAVDESTGNMAAGGISAGAISSTDGFTTTGGMTAGGILGGNLTVQTNALIDGNLNVLGAITAGTKDFKIDDPLDPADRYLYHASVESSEVMNMYTGNVSTDELGDATVQFPAWFEVLNRDFRYQLTVIGQFAQAIVASKIANHTFRIKTDKPNVEVSWQITGVRQDAYAKAHPLVVEEDKPVAERGYYLHPEFFGQPESKGISYARKSPARDKRPESAKGERAGN